MPRFFAICTCRKAGTHFAMQQIMSQPRRIIPGTIYMLTRRCYQRTFRLRPSELTNQIFMYCIAYAAMLTGVVIHAVCVMSNHHHIVLTDVQGRIPDFARELHRLTAKAMNASQGQWENLWSAEPYHLLELGAGEDVIDKIAYVAANPVDAGLVASPEEWPGVMLLPSDGGTMSQQVQRPTTYFGDESTCPEEVDLAIVPPKIEALGERLAHAITGRVDAARAKMAAIGWAFLGAKKVMSKSFIDRAKSFEIKRAMVPRVAAKSMFLRRKMLKVHKEFRRGYHSALKLWREGLRAVVFPAGTWWMRVFHGATVAALPAIE
jgi:REP element-mobilizing transposase RayT